MRFGPIAVEAAAGAILAHTLRVGGVQFRKGRLLSLDDLAVLHAAGVAEVIAVQLESGDLGEDLAAARVAGAVAGNQVSVGAAFTGRANLFAAAAGLALIDAARLDQLNRRDEAVTVATVPAFAPVAIGQMVATVKIIPFGAPTAVVAAAEALASAGGALVAVAPWRGLRAVLIQTQLPGLKSSVLDKTALVTRERLTAVAIALIAEHRCRHDPVALAATLAALDQPRPDLILIAGASAIADRGDVIPTGIERAGGRIEHFGMPVDPGNLLLLAELNGRTVLGLPGCARSPKLNGFDWVLQRLAAGLPVSRFDIMGMGVGGLLSEISSRPRPRTDNLAGVDIGAPRAARIAALVLAAGSSRRMGATNKLLTPFEGVPMVARVVDRVLASAARPVVAVLGHQAAAVRTALAGRPVELVENLEHDQGLSTSLRAGLAALPEDLDGVLVCLGDMPLVPPAVLDRLIAAYNPENQQLICVPTRHGKRGNPILWDRRYFVEMAAVTGDAGARSLLGRHAEAVCEVAVETAGILIDIDTPEALAQATASEF